MSKVTSRSEIMSLKYLKLLQNFLNAYLFLVREKHNLWEWRRFKFTWSFQSWGDKDERKSSVGDLGWREWKMGLSVARAWRRVWCPNNEPEFQKLDTFPLYSWWESVTVQERKHGSWCQDSWLLLQLTSYTSFHRRYFPPSLQFLHISSKYLIVLSRGKYAYLNGSSSSSFQLGFGPSAVVVWQIVRWKETSTKGRTKTLKSRANCKSP